MSCYGLKAVVRFFFIFFIKNFIITNQSLIFLIRIPLPILSERHSLHLLTAIEAFKNWTTFVICRIKSASGRKFTWTGLNRFTNRVSIVTNA